MKLFITYLYIYIIILKRYIYWLSSQPLLIAGIIIYIAQQHKFNIIYINFWKTQNSTMQCACSNLISKQLTHNPDLAKQPEQLSWDISNACNWGSYMPVAYIFAQIVYNFIARIVFAKTVCMQNGLTAVDLWDRKTHFALNRAYASSQSIPELFI